MHPFVWRLRTSHIYADQMQRFTVSRRVLAAAPTHASCNCGGCSSASAPQEGLGPPLLPRPPSPTSLISTAAGRAAGGGNWCTA